LLHGLKDNKNKITEALSGEETADGYRLKVSFEELQQTMNHSNAWL
jgi:hypothetical protein